MSLDYSTSNSRLPAIVSFRILKCLSLVTSTKLLFTACAAISRWLPVHGVLVIFVILVTMHGFIPPSRLDLPACGSTYVSSRHSHRRRGGVPHPSAKPHQLIGSNRFMCGHVLKNVKLSRNPKHPK